MPSARLTAQAVADLVGGRLRGDGNLLLSRLAPLESAGPDELAFLVSEPYLTQLAGSQAGAVLVAARFDAATGGPGTRITVSEPERALRLAAEAFHPGPPATAGIDSSARMGRGATVGRDVHLGPFVVVGAGAHIGPRSRLEAGVVIGDGVSVGEDCILGPHVVCYSGVRLGHRVRIKAGAVIGGEGFGFLRSAAGHERVPHVGGCVLEDDVEVGSNSTIDRGSFSDTVIGRGTKIDNQVHIGHNCRFGARCLIMGTTGIAGSVRVGDDVIITGGVGIADHTEVGDGATISAKSVVFGGSRIAPGSVVGGYPARPHREFLRAQAALYRLAPHISALEAMARERAQRDATND